MIHFKLAQSVQIYSNIKGIKEHNFKFSVTLHLFLIASTVMYILWIIKLLYNYLKLMFHWNKIKKKFAEEISSIIRTKTQGHNMVSGVVISTSLKIAFSAPTWFHWNKIKKKFAEEISSTIRTKTQGHNMVSGVVISTSLKIAFSAPTGRKTACRRNSTFYWESLSSSLRNCTKLLSELWVNVQRLWVILKCSQVHFGGSQSC